MKQTRNGLLLVVSGPAGVGKGTVDAALLSRNSRMRMSVSATTRAPRPGEIDGVHYFFKTEEEFTRMIEENAFLEYMHVFHTNYYGTPRSFVEQELASGRDVILEIDVQGGMKVKESYPDAVLVFIAPPDMSTLQSRLIGRGTETPEAIEKRFATAYAELEYAAKYDYVVVNDVIDIAVGRMESIIAAETCRTARNQTFLTKLRGGRNEL